MNKGIIFDIDGTLWNSTKTVLKAWNLALDEAGLDAIKMEDVLSCMGLTGQQIADKLLPEQTQETKMSILQNCFNIEHQLLENEGGELFPYEKEVLEELAKEYPLFILTNAGPTYIELFLNDSKLAPFFTDSLSHGENGKSKTENIKILMERHHLENAVYVGDTRDDQIYSQNVPVPFIFASYGFGKAIDPEYSINDLSELPMLIKSIL